MGSRGILSFGSPYNSGYSRPFSVWSRDYLIAPFWDYVSTRRGGRVIYEVHESGHFLEQVTTFLQIKRPSNFTGTWMLVAHWDAVHSIYWHLRGKVSCLGVGGASIIIILHILYRKTPFRLF